MGLMIIHKLGIILSQVGCSDSVSFSGLHYILASLYAVENINQNQKLLGELKLGLDIWDECDRTVSIHLQNNQRI